jgi:hypothetical protein
MPAATDGARASDFTLPEPACYSGRCGCIASAGLHAVARHRLPGGIRVGPIFDASLRVGDAVRKVREAVSSPRSAAWRDEVLEPAVHELAAD